MEIYLVPCECATSSAVRNLGAAARMHAGSEHSHCTDVLAIFAWASHAARRHQESDSHRCVILHRREGSFSVQGQICQGPPCLAGHC